MIYGTMANHLPLVDWLEIEASAPAKFIISGEYSVVYDKQAIAAAIDIRTRVKIKPTTNGKVRLNLKNLNNIREWTTTSLSMCRLVTKFSECLDFDDEMPLMLNGFLDSNYHVVQGTEQTTISSELKKKADDAVIAFLLLYIGIGDSFSSSARPSIDVEVESMIPVGSGLGSSSALSVALCGALLKVFRVSAEKYIISKWAYNIDKYFHGRPSGVDNNIITNGGFILFQTGKIKASGVNPKIPLKVMLIDTGVSRSTRALCKSVSDQIREQPTRVELILNNINECTSRIWRELINPKFMPLNIAEDLRLNQELLDSLGVGHDKLTDIFMKAERFDRQAKQTGAGGGGTAFVLYNETDDSDQMKQLRNAFTDAGYNVHEHSIGCEGLVVKIKPDPERNLFA